MRISFYIVMIIALHIQQLYAQPFSTFEYRKGKNAVVHPLENFDKEESFLMAFQFESHLDLVFLNDKMELQRIQQVENFPPNLQGREIQGLMNGEDNLHLFISASTHKDKYKTELLSINKENGSYNQRSLAAEIPEMQEVFSSLKLNLVKVFQYENTFYKLWVDINTSSLFLYAYDLKNPEQTVFKTFINPFEKGGINNSSSFGKRLGKRMVIPVPVITDARDASIVSNAKEEKIYLFGNEILISVENPGTTDLVVINTDTWEISAESYEVPDYIFSEREQKLNSFIYEGFLYQVLFNSRGLHLYKVDFDSQEIVHSEFWKDDRQFYEDFSLRRMRQMRGSSLRVNNNPNLWQQFSQSLAIVIHPEESYERLMIGSHRYTNQRKRDIINTIGAVASVGAGIGASGFLANGNAADLVAVIDPFASVNYIIDASYYLNEGRIFQGDCLFNPNTFRMSSIEVEPSRWDEILEHVDQKTNEQYLHSVALFERGDKVFFGYWKKKKYYLVEF